MTTGTAIKCNKESEHHSGSLRKDGDGYICQECWAKEHEIKLKEAKGRQTICPKCGKVLMTKYRGGRVSIGNMSMRGATATLVCDCGYEKVVPNPFGGRPQNRDEAARMRLREKARSTNK